MAPLTLPVGATRKLVVNFKSRSLYSRERTTVPTA